MLTEPREVLERELSAIDTELRELIDGVGLQKQAAHYAGVTQQQISNYRNPGRREQATVRAMFRLERRSGNVRVTDLLAQLHGCVLVPLPDAVRGGEALDLITSRLLKEIGELIGKLADARADGKLCHKDRAAVRAELSDAVAVLMMLRNLLDTQDDTEAS